MVVTMVEKEREIKQLRQEIEEIQLSLPAHSVSASQLMHLEELQERLDQLTGEGNDAPD
jgi:SMC interacting uncharacterized protein involved in chromosome segregation